jgi:hypothetical protein
MGISLSISNSVRQNKKKYSKKLVTSFLSSCNLSSPLSGSGTGGAFGSFCWFTLVKIPEKKPFVCYQGGFKKGERTSSLLIAVVHTWSFFSDQWRL